MCRSFFLFFSAQEVFSHPKLFADESTLVYVSSGKCVFLCTSAGFMVSQVVVDARYPNTKAHMLLVEATETGLAACIQH